MKILVLCSDNPNPPTNGTRIRNFYLWPEIKNLGHEVRILSLTRNAEDLKLSKSDFEFFMFTRKNIFFRVWKRLFHSYHEYPVSESMENRVKEIIEEWKPDVVHADELRMGHYIPENKKKNSPMFSICAHNVESELIKKTMAAPFPFAKKFFNSLYRKNLIAFEKKVFSKTQIHFTYSDLDKKKYETLYPEFAFLSSSNGVNFIDLSDNDKIVPASKNLLFLGSLNYLPNMEGLFWFIDNIYPSFTDRINFIVAGSTPLSIVKERLIKAGITLIDTPLDLRPIYTNTSLLIVPLLNGSGTRGKILESLMYNRPVLTTTLGVEGLHLSEGEGTIIADGKEKFRVALERWLNLDQKERQNIADKGREAVLQTYTWKKVAESLLKEWHQKMLQDKV